MKIIENTKLIENLKWRYATKKFDPSKKISDQDWKAIEDALILTPSSYGLQPWKFIVVKNQEIKDKLTLASWNQKQVSECSHMLVFAALNKMTTNYVEHFIAKTAEIRGQNPSDLAGFQSMLVKNIVEGNQVKNVTEWATKQCYIALGNAMTVASILGIDACPMEGIDPNKYDEILNLKNSNYQTAVALPFGYRDSSDKYASTKKVRFPSQELIQYIN
jgi:nitroreductase